MCLLSGSGYQIHLGKSTAFRLLNQIHLGKLTPFRVSEKESIMSVKDIMEKCISPYKQLFPDNFWTSLVDLPVAIPRMTRANAPFFGAPAQHRYLEDKEISKYLTNQKKQQIMDIVTGYKQYCEEGLEDLSELSHVSNSLTLTLISSSYFEV